MTVTVCVSRCVCQRKDPPRRKSRGFGFGAFQPNFVGSHIQGRSAAAGGTAHHAHGRPRYRARVHHGVGILRRAARALRERAGCPSGRAGLTSTRLRVRDARARTKTAPQHGIQRDRQAPLLAPRLHPCRRPEPAALLGIRRVRCTAGSHRVARRGKGGHQRLRKVGVRTPLADRCVRLAACGDEQMD